MTALVFPPALSVGLVLGLEALALGVVLWLASPWIAGRRPGIEPYVAIGRTLALVTGIVLVVAAFLGEQTPYSDLRNPVSATVTSVTAGESLYQANCSRCHGVDGRGGGPDAGTTQVRPANLRSGHLNSHTDGDVFYWITNGLPGGMPAWASSVSDDDRWNLVNYLRSINGRGPTAPPSSTPNASGPAGSGGPAPASPSAATGLLLVPGFGLLVAGWLAAGVRRARGRRR